MSESEREMCIDLQDDGSMERELPCEDLLKETEPEESQGTMSEDLIESFLSLVVRKHL